MRAGEREAATRGGDEGIHPPPVERRRAAARPAPPAPPRPPAPRHASLESLAERAGRIDGRTDGAGSIHRVAARLEVLVRRLESHLGTDALAEMDSPTR